MTILDNFARANQGPPPSASWTSSPDPSVGGGLVVETNRVKGTTASTNNQAWWNAQQFGPDSRVFVEDVQHHSQSWLWLRLTNPGTATHSAYQAQIGNPTSLNYQIVKVVNGVSTNIVPWTAGITITHGDSWEFKAIGTTLTLSRRAPGGSTWSTVWTGTDTSLTGAGFLALTIRNAVSTVDTFGGNTISAAPAFDPVSLNVSANGSTASLSWPAAVMSGATHYDIFRRSGISTAAFNPNTDTRIARVPVSNTTYNDQGLTTGNYVWQVFPVAVT